MKALGAILIEHSGCFAVTCSPSTTLRLAVNELQQYKLLLLESYFKECAKMPVTHELHKKQLGEMCCSE